MGFSGVVRWSNAPTTALELIAQNIIKNHQGTYKGKWQLSMKSFRSGLGLEYERLMCTLTMDENVFCVLEDPTAPMRTEYLANPAAFGPITHFRHTFPTLSPPLALEQLLAQLRARWTPARMTRAGQAASTVASGSGGQPGGGAAGGVQGGTGPQLVVEGHVYAIGSDWLVRAGNVMLSGGAVKGMLVELEYVPLPLMETTPDLQAALRDMFLALIPVVPDPRMVAMALGEWAWAEVQWDTEEELQREADRKKAQEDDDDIYATEDDHPPFKKGDWIGLDRDRRSAYMIINVLKQEGLL